MSRFGRSSRLGLISRGGARAVIVVTAVAVAVASAAVVGVPARAARASVIDTRLVRAVDATSANWSGYASTSTTFSSVSASWVQPAGICSSKTTYSSFWVGIDGDGSNSVEQTGSEVDCQRGSPRYYSWFEMYPNFPVKYGDPVHPGDLFRASVTTDGAGHFTLTLSDDTAGWSHSALKTYTPAARHSAEIIAEAPSSSQGVLPLTDFGKVSFTSAQANGQSIGSLRPDAITMASATVVKAVPSSLSGGTNFSVAWRHR